MPVRLKGRRRAAASAAQRVVDWARADPGVHAVIQVGSYARGTETMASDLDLVVIVDDALVAAESADARGLFPRARVIARRRWGPVHEVRLRTSSGLLGLIFQTLALVCDSVWALAAGTARAWFARSPRRISTLSGAGGVMMIGLGGVLAVSGSKS